MVGARATCNGHFRDEWVVSPMDSRALTASITSWSAGNIVRTHYQGTIALENATLASRKRAQRLASRRTTNEQIEGDQSGPGEAAPGVLSAPSLVEHEQPHGILRSGFFRRVVQLLHDERR